MNNTITTTNLADFGYREIGMTATLLNAYLDNPNILGDGTQIMFNIHSGCVFLTDEDCNVAMMNGKKLEKFYNCSNCGHEGFTEEFAEHPEAGCIQCPTCVGEDGKIYK
jgi:hypothetical protein